MTKATVSFMNPNLTNAITGNKGALQFAVERQR